MSIPLKLVDHGELLSLGLTEKVRGRTRELALLSSGVEACRLTVDRAGKHRRPNRVRVCLYLSVSGNEIAVSHQRGENLSVALRSAFEAASRRLKAHARLGRKSSRQDGVRSDGKS